MNHVKEKIHYWCDETRTRICRGQNIRVAILDTGIANHPDFGNRIVAFYDVVNHKTQRYDDSNHGTHVAGILAGSGKVSGGVYSGMAPGAELVIIKVLDENGDGSIQDVVEGMKWVLAHWQEYQIRVVNISVGTKPDIPKKNTEVLIDLTEKLWDAGIVVVASAGNYGPKRQSISIPGTSRKIITVGALANEEVMGSSSRGPTEECIIKPDILAPGYKIVSCQGRWYAAKSGTSMSAPIVAGAAALYLSRYPRATNVEIKLLMHRTMDERRQIHVERMLHTVL